MEVQQQAAILETLIKNGAPEPEIFTLSRRVEDLQSTLAMAILGALPSEYGGTPRPPLDPEKGRAALARLENLLAADEMSSQDCLREVQPLLADLMPEAALKVLLAQVENFDFQAALDTLRAHQGGGP
ncbi:MAG: hypothetical protein H6935_06965 [Thiobacillus sp.]|nr:hypothetical protein [Thiobacillus sp.]